MAEDKDFEQKISADPTGFLSGWQKAVAGAASGADQIKGHASKIGDAFAAIQKPLLAIGALVAGGAFFKDAIGVTNKLNGEAMSLAKTLGITGTEATTLRTALDDIGSDSDTYIGAFQKFAKQLRTNEAGLQAMGLQTRDANGHLRDSNTLFTEGLQTVSTYKAGLDQQTAAQTIFGKGVNEVMALQKLNNKVLEDAKTKNEELGLTMTKEGVEASKKYKLAMNDVGDVFIAIKNVIGQAVMPIFTQLGEWFSEIGPTAVTVFRVAIDAVATALQFLVLGLKVVFNVLRALVDPLVTFGSAIKKLFSGDINGATNDMMNMGAKWANAWSQAFDKIGTDARRTNTEIDNLWGKGTAVAKPGAGTKTMGDFGKTNGGGGQDKSRMGEWEAALSERKAAIERQGMLEGQYREMSKAEEQKYWDDLKNMQGLSAQERNALTRKAAETEMAGIKQNFEVKVASLQAEAAAYKNNTEQRMSFELQIQAKYQQGTKEYEASAKRIVEIQRQAAEQERTIRQARVQAERDARLASLALEEQTTLQAEQLGVVSHAQLLAAQQSFELQRTTIAREAMQERLANALADPDRNPVEIDKINHEIEALEQQHALRMGQIRGLMQIESSKYQTDFFQGMQSNLQGSLTNILVSTQKLSATFKNMFVSIGTTMAQTVAKMTADWVMGQIKMRLASKETTLAQLNNAAVAAAGNAYNAIVGIPYVGPFLAPVAAAVAYAGVMAFGASASAEGGFDIPGNVNPIVQTHAREMILPAKHADVIRNLADSGGGAGGGGGTLNYHDHTGTLTPSSIRENAKTIARELSRLDRQFFKPV